jgi:hypothetical protein
VNRSTAWFWPSGPLSLSLAVTKTHQLDCHIRFGLNRSSVDHYFGIGYSFRLGGLLGGPVGNSL